MAPTPKEVVTEIGKAYMEYPVSPEYSDPDAYQWVNRAFERMKYTNRELLEDIPVPVVFQAEDPYDDYQDMAETVAREGRLRVFSGGDPHPIWREDAELASRAVHDWYGHLKLDVDFTPTGEYLKWEHSRDHYPAYCDRVFFTEVVGQLGAVHYLPDGFADDRFEQKVFPAPPEWIERMSRAVRVHSDYYDD